MYRATESPSNSFTPVVDQQTTPWHGSYPTRDACHYSTTSQSYPYAHYAHESAINNYYSQSINHSYYNSSTYPQVTSYPVHSGHYVSENQQEPSIEQRSESVEQDESEENNKSEEENKENCLVKKDMTNIQQNYPIYMPVMNKQPANPTKLSYTIFQKKILEAVFAVYDYPNSPQKSYLSQVLGITRDQLKIWFQNRRRKNVLNRQNKAEGKSGDENNNLDNDDLDSKHPNDQTLKASIAGVLEQMKKLKNGPSRLVKKGSSSGDDFNLELIPKTKRKKSTSKSSSSADEKSFECGGSMSKKMRTDDSISECATIYNDTASAIITCTPISSSSSSISSSSSSSSEEEIQAKSYQAPCNLNFNVVKQAYSLQDYVSDRQIGAYPRIHQRNSTPNIHGVVEHRPAPHHPDPSNYDSTATNMIHHNYHHTYQPVTHQPHQVWSPTPINPHMHTSYPTSNASLHYQPPLGSNNYAASHFYSTNHYESQSYENY